VGKWIEAASYSLVHHPDPTLEAKVDDAIALLGGAQQSDGYLNAYFTVVKPGQRFTDLRDAHELYCLGHLIEGAVAHNNATGKSSFLDIVCRYADLVDREFAPGGAAAGGYDGHEEIGLALVKLARVTGRRRYIDLALRMLNARGTQPFYFDAEAQRRGDDGYFAPVLPERLLQPQRFREYNQTHLPVREQSDAVGHAVRAMYLYSAMTDLAVETGDKQLLEASRQLWESVSERKLYVTGGIGADASIEGFGRDFELPNETSYNETCASIGLMIWARGMALATGEARYADVMERALYNTVLAGSSADGTSFFYGNPMQSDGDRTRAPWFGVACCPPNYARLIQSLETYAFARGPSEAIINLYLSGEATFHLDNGDARVRIDTGYPWAGEVRMVVETPGDWLFSVRVPEWAAQATASLNGTEVDLASVVKAGYLRVRRSWQAGDVLTLQLPLETRRVWAHPAVRADAGKVALQRGPLVYCVESVDNPAPVDALGLGRKTVISEVWDESLGAVALVFDGLWTEELAWRGDLYGASPPGLVTTPVRAIPYVLWANRGPSSMRVWLNDYLGTA
jgi:DUF1680 family protein